MYHCDLCRDSGWLPLDLPACHDEIVGEMLLLFPSQEVECPCNVTPLTNNVTTNGSSTTVTSAEAVAEGGSRAHGCHSEVECRGWH
jgi:hypothetical protein